MTPDNIAPNPDYQQQRVEESIAEISRIEQGIIDGGKFQTVYGAIAYMAERARLEIISHFIDYTACPKCNMTTGYCDMVNSYCHHCDAVPRPTQPDRNPDHSAGVGKMVQREVKNARRFAGQLACCIEDGELDIDEATPMIEQRDAAIRQFDREKFAKLIELIGEIHGDAHSKIHAALTNYESDTGKEILNLSLSDDKGASYDS